MEGLRNDVNKMIKITGLEKYNNLTNIVLEELNEMIKAFDECEFYYEIQMKIILHSRNIFRKGINIVEEPDDILKVSYLSKMIKKRILNILSKSVA